MLFLQFEKNEIKKFPLILGNIRALHKNISFPETITQNMLPKMFAEVTDINNKSLDESLSIKVKNYTPVKVSTTHWKLNITVEELEKETLPVFSLTEVKNTKLLELSELINIALANKLQTLHIPDFEIASWTLQAQEALMWEKDSNYETPLLSTIAQNRQIDLPTLREKTLIKAITYQTLTGSLIGQRQYYEDRIMKSVTIEELENIYFDIQ